MPEIDAWIRRNKKGLTTLEGDELVTQRVVWMNSINISMITEINAIFMANIAYIVFDQHRLSFQFGYTPGEASVRYRNHFFCFLLKSSSVVLCFWKRKKMHEN